MNRLDRTKLFHSRLISEKLSTYQRPSNFRERLVVASEWAALAQQGVLAVKGEAQLDRAFVRAIFGQVLGYRQFEEAIEGEYLCEIQQAVDQVGTADAALGWFNRDPKRQAENVTMVPVEIKPAGQDLDKPTGAKGRSPVRQLFDYVLGSGRFARFGIVSNLYDIRLYSKEEGSDRYELFELNKLAQPDELARFIFLCGPDCLLWQSADRQPRASELLSQTHQTEQRISRDFYKEYKGKRQAIFDDLVAANPTVDKELLLEKVQKIIDRIMFIRFAEDRKLLPAFFLQHQMERDMYGIDQRRKLSGLFEAVDQGWQSKHGSVTAYNGMLFAPDAELEQLLAQTYRFTKTQYLTSLDFSYLYNWNFRSEVNVRILGHIFEQSISDIEEQKALFRGVKLTREGSRRKKEGVYYTPQYITSAIVGGCLDRWLEGCRAKAPALYPGDELQQLLYENECLKAIKVLDPACGSGAFLVAALERVVQLRIALASRLSELGHTAGEPDSELELAREVLANNIFGVDLNAESVEITKLSLWLETAEPGHKLLTLEQNILPGDSLVHDPGITHHAFEWDGHFGEIMEGGGFDIIIGNPPYVKLQNLKLTSKYANWLKEHYISCRFGNYDVYLPFIERALGLLKPTGWLGFIAPSLWLKNEYGQGLRQLVLERRALRHWVDFGWQQVFEDGTSYTALQFFGNAGENITHSRAQVLRDELGRGSGSVESEYWEQAYTSLPGVDEAWILLAPQEREIHQAMHANTLPLKDACGGIHVGLQTSANNIYHLRRIAPNEYMNGLNEQHRIEDRLVRPLLGGDELQRYAAPNAKMHILFPYHEEGGKWELIPWSILPSGAKKYLIGFEGELRARESGKFDNDKWYQLYPKNIDKQHLPKLCVAETVRELELTYDTKGDWAMDNVRVNGIYSPPDAEYSMWYLLGVLNSSASTWFWRFIAAPKQHGYFEANKQYLEPLPIPIATPAQQQPVIELAQELTHAYTEIQRIHGRFLHDLVRDILPGSAALSDRLKAWQGAEFDFKALRYCIEDAHEGQPADKDEPRLRKPVKWSMRKGECDEWEARLHAAKEEYGKTQAHAAECDERMDKLVFALYGLTDEQRALIRSHEWGAGLKWPGRGH